MRTRWARSFAGALAALPLVLVPSAAASTIVGKVPGEPVTFGGSPVGQVLAVDPATARSKAGAAYTRNGSYRLSVPRGTYLVLAPVRGKGGRTLTTRSRIFRLRGGQRRRVSMTRKTPRARPRTQLAQRHSARAAAGKLLKVSVFGSRVSGGGLEYLSRAVDSILITDLFEAKRGIKCPVEVYEDRKSDGFKAIQQEVRLQQSSLVDPRTRVRPLYNTPRYTPKFRITATLRANGSSLTGSIVARQISTGKVKASQTITRSTNSIVNGFVDELHELLMELCEPGPPDAYTGSVSGTGSYDAAEVGSGNSLEASWNGTVGLRKAPAMPGLPDIPGFPAAIYTLSTGQIQYTFNGRLGDCSVAGSGPIDLGAQPDVAGIAVLQVYDGDPRTYSLSIPIPLLVTVHGTKSNCDNPNNNGGDLALAPALGVPWLVRASLPGGPVGDDWSLSGSGSGGNGPGSPDQTWQWNLSPSS